MYAKRLDSSTQFVHTFQQCWNTHLQHSIKKMTYCLVNSFDFSFVVADNPTPEDEKHYY